MNPKVDWFFEKPTKWQQEYIKLRTIILDFGLTEELKWGCPCYTFNDKNVVLIHGFKEYCAILFVKGALLSDPKGILIQQTENVQAGRQVRFTNLKEIVKLAPTITAYIKEAAEVERKGLKITHKTTADYAVPDEFQLKLDENPSLKRKFQALTPGRQRQYLFYFSQAKQSKTRTARIAKCLPLILMGKGMDD